MNRRARTIVLAAVLAAPSLVFTSGPSLAQTAQPVPAHPFSDPVWYPLRQPATVGCVNGNPGTRQSTGKEVCRHPTKAGYPAMDVLSGNHKPGAPVYAAGAGIFHIGGNDGSCVSSGPQQQGRWVWVDHGGGVVSRYHHLKSIPTGLHNGAYVTPTTVIGRMGDSGTHCGTYYLHFEVRKAGVHGLHSSWGVGPRSNGVGSLYACSGATQQTWPHAIDPSANNWNQVTWNSLTTPTSGNACIPPTPATPDRPSSVTAKAGNAKITLRWTAPGGAENVNGITIGEKIYRPSQNGYSQEAWVPVGATATSMTFTHSTDGKALVNGRDYRFRVTFHNGNGFSRYSPWITVAPHS
jgi:hypothetical protein